MDAEHSTTDESRVDSRPHYPRQPPGVKLLRPLPGNGTDMNALTSRYPRLGAALSPCTLGTFPTPVEPLPALGRKLGRERLFIKRDDLSGELYGGNKVRKLEFLLPEAKRKGARRIVTSGAAGSNHALATALYSRKCGFPCTLMLFEQHFNKDIGHQLLADRDAGAEMYYDETYARHLDHLGSVVAEYTRQGETPYVIPPGGSSPLGAVGFVSAAFEIEEQIASGLLPAPGAVFVAFGTMGTAAGLLLGFRAARIPARLIAVRVVPETVANLDKFCTLYRETNRLLHSEDPSFPLCTWNERDFEICDDFLGDGYGIPTTPALEAISTLKETDSIALDPVYTGKTGAAFLAAAASGKYRDVPLLLWHTKSRPAPFRDTRDFRTLPVELHRYFKEVVKK